VGQLLRVGHEVDGDDAGGVEAQPDDTDELVSVTGVFGAMALRSMSSPCRGPTHKDDAAGQSVTPGGLGLVLAAAGDPALSIA
jgi:hypothetical protein